MGSTAGLIEVVIMKPLTLNRVFITKNLRDVLLFKQLLSFTTFMFVFASDAFAVDLIEVGRVHSAQAEHCDQNELIAISDPLERFTDTFECGDELFATRFNALDGVGANVGDNLRFTRVPRADKKGADEWFSHYPARATGPNAETCAVCHSDPFDDGSGLAGVNVVRDPLRQADVTQFIQRNTPHMFGAGALQRLAEEMTVLLHEQVNQARALSCAQSGTPIFVNLTAKDIGFGSIMVFCSGLDDTSRLVGIDPDLVVKPYQWKGNFPSLRSFNRDAAHNEIGMQPVETTGDGIDGDGDGVMDEMGIGDITALSVYLASQPRPVTKLELDDLGLLQLTRDEKSSIRHGGDIFKQSGCGGCHRPSMTVDDPIFSEPSQVAEFRETVFPAGQDALTRGVDPANPITFDLTKDQPENIIDVNGKTIHFGTFEKNRDGGAIIRLYGDLKRHDMGSTLAENIDETGVGASVWMTKELWGVGSTPPYLHDGRATTLMEAILEHGGEAQTSRDTVFNLSDNDKTDLIAFLDNLVLFKIIEDNSTVVNQFPHRHRDGGHDRTRDRRFR